MANTKNVPTENITSDEIDIQKLIQEAVAKAVAETSKNYLIKIDELSNQLNDKKQESLQDESSVTSVKPDKMVKIMSMAPANATFDNGGRVKIKFNKLFDERRTKFEILDEMYYAYRSWFDAFEIIILDKEVREYYGIEYDFKEHGADKKKFYEMLKMNNLEMLKTLDDLSLVVKWSFLNFFLEEYIKQNPDCLKDNKFNEVINYYESKYGISNVQEAIGEMMVKK